MPPKSTTTPQTDAAQQARAERLATALRENLKKRKAQARGRASADREPAPEKPDSQSR